MTLQNRQEFPQDFVDDSTESTRVSTRFCRWLYRIDKSFHKILSIIIESKFKNLS